MHPRDPLEAHFVIETEEQSVAFVSQRESRLIFLWFDNPKHQTTLSDPIEICRL
jgi:hypothetical protein